MTEAPARDIRAWARIDPRRPAVVAGGRTLDYGSLEAAVNRLARVLREAGLRRGDHVAALVPNGPLPFLAAWAAYRCGVYLTPIATTLTAAEAAYVVDDSRAGVVLLDRSLPSAAALVSAVGDRPRWLATGAAGENWPAPRAVRDLDEALAAQADTPIDDESPGGTMFYTSGTTGRPKGVLRPLPAPGSAGPPPFASDLLALFDIDDATRYLSTAPLYHAAPLRFALAVTAAGGTVHAMARFDPEAALEALETHGITHSQWVPTMFRRLLALPAARRERFRAPAHQLALHAAAPCPPDLKRAMIDWWGPILTEYYSGSEGVGLTAIDANEWLQRPGSVGRARKGVIHVLGEGDEELGPGPTGRIYFSGTSPFEYFNAPEKTRALTSRQGWQTFGDVGHVDEAGYLFLTDRLDDVINSGGVNVYPQEIELALRQLPEVEDVAVAGLPHPDFGECPVAWVVPAAALRGQAERVRAAVIAHAEIHLGRTKRPAEVRVIDELPRSPTGKLLRRVLRESTM